MNEPRTYLASDLAAELGVPRTTVNDWLARYAPYLETELRGKRRAYTENSLAILREVLALRNEDRAATEIEAELAKRHGIRPEVAPEPTAEPESASPEPVGTELAARAAEHGLARISPDDFNKLFAAFKEQEAERAVAMRRFRISLVLLALLLLVALGVPLIWLGSRVLADLRNVRSESTARYRSTEAHNAELARQVGETGAAVQRFHTENTAKLDLAASRAAAAAEAASKSADSAEKIRRAQELELAKIAIALDKYQQDYQSAVAKLKAEYEQNKQLRDRELERLAADKDKFAEAERIRLKEEFASQQKAKLEAIERDYKNRLEDARKLAETRQADLEKKLAAERAGQTDLEKKLAAERAGQTELEKKLAAERAKRTAAEALNAAARRQNLKLLYKTVPGPISDEKPAETAKPAPVAPSTPAATPAVAK